MYVHVCFLQEPKEVKLGEPQCTVQFSGSKRRLTERFDTFQYISLLSTLSKLLSDCDIRAQIQECHKRVRNDDVKRTKNEGSWA